MSDSMRFILPFSYFLKTRLVQKKDVIFHLWYEWIIAFLILAYNYDWDFLITAEKFLLSYLAFISIYELGYFSNDIYATKFELNPRKRIKDFNPAISSIVIWVGVRLIFFGAVSYYLELWSNLTWIVFYTCLVVVYVMHNTLKNNQVKLMTFFQLAFFRFIAPVFIFLNKEVWELILIPIIVNYVFYRTLTYMESKGLSNIYDRPLVLFKVKYYLFFSVLGIFLSVIMNSFIPILIHLYYLLFWCGLLFFIRDQPKGLRKQ